MSKQVLVYDSAAEGAKQSFGSVPAEAMPTQLAIADLSLGTLLLLGDVITGLGTVQSKVNTLLAELRLAGIIAP